MGIGGRLATGMSLARSSWSAVFKNPSLLVFPLVSLASQKTLIVLYWVADDPLELLGIFDRVGSEDASSSDRIMAALASFVIYMIFMTLTLFFNVALISCAGRVLSGERPGLMRGLRDAAVRVHYILIWGGSVTRSHCSSSIWKRTGT